MMYMEWRGYTEQNCQGNCPHCDEKTFEFIRISKKDRTKKDFKNVLGYSLDCQKPGSIIILMECPECFEKSYFHAPKEWAWLYPFLKDIDNSNSDYGKEASDE